MPRRRERRRAVVIDITRPYLPSREEFDRLVDELWSRNWLTNNGPFVNRLELELKQYLGIEHLLCLANGTLALQLAVKALGLRGEVITTPFSYVATTAALVWEGLRPRYVDIDSATMNLDPNRVEEAINEHTAAILAVHVYGNPCDVDALRDIAGRHGIRVVYDAAHAFAVRLNGDSVLRHGDVSCLSFHATKLFHTVEGGAVTTNDPETLKRMAYMRNFGHDGPFRFNGVGINAKLSELHAAMGLCNLRHMDEVLARRRELCSHYDHWLVPQGLLRPSVRPDCEWNYAYYAVLFPSEKAVEAAVQQLEANGIHPRRYFFPVLSALDYVERSSTPVAEDVASRVLCLPLMHSLTTSEIDFVCRIIIRSQRYMCR
jgi:dTDP-4-amino-4,6-dideoxygalactose transaminase